MQSSYDDSKQLEEELDQLIADLREYMGEQPPEDDEPQPQINLAATFLSFVALSLAAQTPAEMANQAEALLRAGNKPKRARPS